MSISIKISISFFVNIHSDSFWFTIQIILDENRKYCAFLMQDSRKQLVFSINGRALVEKLDTTISLSCVNSIGKQ